MTAHAMESDHARCLETGLDGYLTKPINPEQLLAAIDTALGQSGRPPKNESRPACDAV
jgi:CheY-like chemotaxis protein